MPSTKPKPDSFPGWGWWPPWSPAAFNAFNNLLTPESLSQPILPGWTFGNIISVNEKNSRAPETERAIVSEESYGRQLGQVLDALAALIQDRPKTAPERPALDQLLRLRDKIEHIKRETLAGRVERLERDLTLLKEESPESLRQIALLLKNLEK